MTQVFLPKGSLMLWGDNAITEHARSPLLVTVTRIENSKRMADATMRRYVIASKYKWTCSWAFLPDQMVGTIDGKWSALEIENFYNTTPGAFTLKIEPLGPVTLTDGTHIVTTTVPHKLVVGNAIQLGTITTSTGISALTTYYVISTPTTTTLTLSATKGGSILAFVNNGTAASLARTYNVMFTEFGKDFSKRGKYTLCNVDVTMEEV